VAGAKSIADRPCRGSPGRGLGPRCPGAHDTSGSLFASTLVGREVAAPNAAIVIAEWIDPGGGTDPPLYIAPLHIHHEDDEAWYVLEGALRIRLGEDEVEVEAGGAALVPRGTVHTYWNPRLDPTRYLLIMTPRVKALINALHVQTPATTRWKTSSEHTEANTSAGPRSPRGGTGARRRSS
jgi:mannose-6-phosphate isomerase-like protein (cupin superfamily)